MNYSDLEGIVSLITQQVLAAMDTGSRTDAPSTEGYDKLLVVGKTDVHIPEDLCCTSVLLELEDYRTHQNILRYDRVIITSLTTTQLADIAQGRATDDVTCAVQQALLNGVDIVMLESALSFRKYAGKGSIALYHLLESYAQTLQVFGIKIANQTRKPVVPEAKPPKFAAPTVVVPKGTAKPNSSRLITESEAMELIKQGNPVHYPTSAILTPLARDAFAQAGVDLVKDP